MHFAKWVYRIAGIYGIFVIAPMFFMEEKIGRDTPPAITHPEYFYGFAGVVLAFQLVFLLMSTDPLRYRPLMPITVVEKLAFAIPIPILFAMHRVPANIFAASIIDAILGILFVVSFLKTRPSTSGAGNS